jgi:hypothetical protein
MTAPATEPRRRTSQPRPRVFLVMFVTLIAVLAAATWLGTTLAPFVG